MSDLNKFKLDEEPFDMTEWTEKIVRKVHETEDAFIFTSVKPFLDSISTFEIQKEELVHAVLLIRMQREAIEKYGTTLPNDYLTAVNMKAELEQAYKKVLKRVLSMNSVRLQSNGKCLVGRSALIRRKKMKTDNEIIAEYEEKFCNKCEHKDHCHVPCVTITRYIFGLEKEKKE